MTNPSLDLLQRHRAAVAALEQVPTDVDAHRSLDDSVLLEINRLIGRENQLIGALGAVAAGEVAHRSEPELGSQGLAQRTGYRTPEELVKVTTGSTGRDASTSVRIGRLAHEAATAGDVDAATGEVATPTQPWLAPVAAALSAQALSLEAADAIRRGLGNPNSAVSAEMLSRAAAQLCREADSLDPDRLTRRARQLRDEMDAAGIAIREEERREVRGLRLSELPDGGGLLTWRMDPETFAIVKETYDRATSPKRGGPRFVSSDAIKSATDSRAERIFADVRTVQQLASDDFLQLIRLGASTNPDFLLGSGAPVIRVTVTRSAFGNSTGHGRIEGQADPISMSTIERLACEGGQTPVIFDETGRPLDVGREQRLFTRRQRTALAVRDGGCMWLGCDRPPSWCEAHHVVFWKRDGGKTNIDDGILLCKHHHLLAHNNGWEIARDELGQYWLTPPVNVDPDQVAVLMRSKSAAMRDLLQAGAAESAPQLQVRGPKWGYANA